MYPGNRKAAKTEMVWERDKIGPPNPCDTIGNSSHSKASEGACGKRGGLITSRSGPADPIAEIQAMATGSEDWIELMGKPVMTRPYGSSRSQGTKARKGNGSHYLNLIHLIGNCPHSTLIDHCSIRSIAPKYIKSLISKLRHKSLYNAHPMAEDSV